MTNEQTGIKSDNIMDGFQQHLNKSQYAEVLKELFDRKKIHMIGDLSKDEIKIATKIHMIAKLKKISVYDKGLEFFMTLLLSKDRKSRREVLDAVKGINTQEGFMHKLNPLNWGRS